MKTIGALNQNDAVDDSTRSIELVARGAEACIYRTPSGFLKERPKKSYRHPALDKELREGRTTREFRILQKAHSLGCHVPGVQQLDKTRLLLVEIQGDPVHAVIDQSPIIAHQIGREVAKLHQAHIIHGDLTTSNMIWRDGVVTLIDFGLAFSSQRVEDMAVDLHVLHQSLSSKHHGIEQYAWRHFLQGYRMWDGASEVILRLRTVQSRGRNKGS